MAQEVQDLRTVLAACGLTQPQCDVLVNQEGFTSIASMGVLGGDGDVLEMAKRLAGRTQVDGRVILGTVQIKNLQALVYWVKDKLKRGQPLNAADWDAQAIITTMTSKDVEKEAKDNYQAPSVQDLGKFKPEDFETFEEGILNIWARTRGAQGEDLRYVVRPDNPPAEFESEQQRRMFQLPLTGVAYDRDNATVFRDLKAMNLNTTGDPWIQPFESTEDGRGAWMAWTDHFNGQGELSKRINLAKTRLGNLHYKSERSMSFELFSARMQKYFQTLDKDPDERKSDRQKVEILVAAFRPESNELASAKVIAIQQYPRDFVGACNYLSAEVSRVSAQAIIDSQRHRTTRKRDVSAVDSRGGGGGRGRGRFGPRGRGPGRGRGNSRGGRDGGRGHGANRSTMFNGVDVSNPRRNFTNDEWNRLGNDGRAYVQNKREDNTGGGAPRGSGANNDNRNVGAVDVEQQQTDTHDNDDRSADARAHGDRGGRNGRGFGRGAYGAGRGSN